MVAQDLANLRIGAEPVTEPGACLMQQHTEAINRRVAPGTRRRYKRRFQGHIDNIVHHSIWWQRVQLKIEWRLPFHAERRRVHDQGCAIQRFCAFVPDYTSDRIAKFVL